MFRSLLYLIPIILLSCHHDEPKLFSAMENTGIDFSNKLTEDKDFNVFKYRNFYNGGGVATGDINNDGFADVFFTSNQGPNKLYLNKGNFTFQDISVKAGFNEKKQWSTGVVFVDINNDGWLDIYVCNAGNMMDSALRRNQLFINNHNLTFTESARQYGLDNNGYTTQASFFDYDLDGDLDCFMVNNSPIPVNTLNYSNMRDLPCEQWNVADFLKGGGDHLYRNDGGFYKEVTKEAGLHGGLISLGLGVTVGDVNGDLYPDVYVSNDFYERDYLYINQHDGTFKDELEQRAQHTSLSSMGADMQDINNDGYQDIFTTDMLPDNDYRLKANTSFENYDVFKLKQNLGFFNQFTQNALLVNNPSGYFSETAFYSGVAASDWSWGALMFDADNDGLSDIFVCNGINRDVTDQDFIDFFANDIVKEMNSSGKKGNVIDVINKMPSQKIPNKAFRNLGDLKFTESGASWGLDLPTFSNGAAYADFDNDGDLDLIVNNVNDKALVYRNNAREFNKNNFLSLSLKYKNPNLNAIGSTIKVYSKGQVHTRELIPSRGFQSSMEYKQTIGLGNSKADSIVVIWPDRTRTRLDTPVLNKLINIHYTETNFKSVQSTSNQLDSAVIFTKTNNSFEKHVEDDYVDFYFERNIPFMLSRQGPKAAVADVNNDGKEDVYIGGSKDQPGQLYLQTSNGFVKNEVPDFKTYSFNDVTAAFFFDADHDGDLDLFTGGGGNFAPAVSGNFISQIFLNDGKGQFTLNRGALPVMNINCGVALPLDYDNDGNTDIFIGGRSVPQDYGTDANSYILKGDGKGNFTDVTLKISPQFKNIGMVSSAVYADLDNDNKKELIIAGDWMYPHIFSFNGNQFTERKSGMENMFGWWQSIAVADIDRNGYPDLILGNLGENFYLHPDEKQPVKLWMKDFDDNQSIDKIFTRSIDGKDYPVFTKREITDQLPSLKKKSLKHHEYAVKTINDLFGEAIEGARFKTVNYTSSCIALNDGKGNFTIKKLPVGVQLSSVNNIIPMDVDGDNYADLVLAGNFFDLLPQFCRLDASRGIVLHNDKQGNFSVMDDRSTGLNIDGEVRDIIRFSNQNKQYLLFLKNSQFPDMYEFHPLTNQKNIK